MGISAADFDFVRDLVRRDAGMVLGDGKEYLVESRLRRLARRQGDAGLTPLLARLRQPQATDALREAVVEAVLIGETRFFRDEHPFEALRQHILPALIEAARERRRLRLWCGASSAGQEPYSLAMVLADFPELANWDVEVLASDLSDLMLDRVRQGTYSEAEITRGLTPELRSRWFEERPPGSWTVKPSLRRRIQIRRINLVAAWPRMPTLDLVLIRNVLIYFDRDTKHDILRRVHDQLRPGGFLLLGTSESLPPEREHFAQVRFGQTICYRRT